MALTPQIQAPQGVVMAAFDATTPELRSPQAAILAAYNVPADFVRATFGSVGVTYRQVARNIEVTQAVVMAVVRGRVFDPKVRAWTFTLDGHDFYVLKLGNDGTIVYDLLAEQWYEWGSDDAALWRAYTGHNWLGGRRLGAGYGSNVIVGDDSTGALYFLDPMGICDDDALQGLAVQRPFLREVMGQISTRGYDEKSCYGVSLMGAIGESTNPFANPLLTAVTLFTSDDDGHSYDQHETINIQPGEYPQDTRVDWNGGLGSFSAPGRLFLIQDRGALQRVDWLDMATDG